MRSAPIKHIFLAFYNRFNGMLREYYESPLLLFFCEDVRALIRNIRLGEIVI